MSYSVMGYKVEPQDQNAANTSAEQQTTEPPLEIIYSTDDEGEAQAIVNAGGFVRDDVWYVAKNYANDIDRLSDSARGLSDAPVRKSELGVPDNSSATVDPVSGRVRTDAGKRPIEQADVDAMAQDQVDFPSKPRTIIN